MVDKICIRCNKLKKHYAKGLCKYCYYYSKYSDKQKQLNKNWRDKNSNYFKEYYLKRKEIKNGQ